MKKRLLSWLLVLTMITSLIPSTLITSAFAAGSTDIDGITQDVPFVTGQAELTLSGSGEYVLQGTQNGCVIKITNRAKVTLLLKNVEMNSPTSPIQVESGAELTLVVADDSANSIGCTATAVTVDGADPNNGMTAGIYVPDGATLNIDTPTNGTGTGKLTVTGGYGGAGIGGKAGTGIDATGTRAPSGVGGARGTQRGAAVASEGQGGAGGIGGRPGNVGGSAGTIVLKSGTISATGGYGGAGIGGGMGATGETGEQGKQGNIGISGYIVGGTRNRGFDWNGTQGEAYSSGGTGGSGQGGAGGTGGKGGSGGVVTIENAAVTATGKNGGADVGGGAGGIGGQGGPGGERNTNTAPVNKLTVQQMTGNHYQGDGQTGEAGYGGKGATGARGRGGKGGEGTSLTILGGSLTRTNQNSVAKHGIDDPTELTEADNNEAGGQGGKASATRYEFIIEENSMRPGDLKIRCWGTNIIYHGGDNGGAGGTGGAQAATQNDGTAGTIVIDRSAEGNATTDFVTDNMLNADVRPVDAKGNALYLYTLTVTELDNATQVSGAKVTVRNVASVSNSTTYTYYAVTNAEGKAQLWLPQGEYTLEGKDVYSETEGWIPGFKSKTFTVTNADSGAGQVVVGPSFTLTASTTNKVYFSNGEKPVTLTVDATSITNNITSVQWFAEPIAGTVNQYDAAADTVNNIKDFDDGYTAANTKGNAGTENVTDDKHTFEIPINENGRYWVKVTYKTGSGTTSASVVNPITVTNIYRKFPLLVNSYVSVKNVHTGETGYGPLKTAGDEVYNGSYGFAWDLNGYNADALDGSKLLDAAVAAYDTVPLVPRSTYATWYNAELLADSNVKFGLNDDAAKGYNPITLTLNKNFLDENLNTKCDTIKSKKDFSKYTIVYTPRDGALTAVTVSGVDKAATDGSTLYSSQISYTEAITQDTLTAHRIKGYKLTGAKIIYADSPEKDVTPTMQADGSYAVSLTNIQGTAEKQYKDRVSEVRFIYEDNMTDITIKAYYVGTTTPVDGFTEYKTPMEVGTKVTYTAPVVDNHINDGSTLADDGTYTVVENGTITFYYYKQTGNVTYKAVLDGTNEVLWQGDGTVKKGNAPATDVLPTDAAFTAKYERKTGDVAKITDSDGAPATVYDGIHSLTVTYTYVHKTRTVTIKQVDVNNTDAVIKTTEQKDNAIGTYATVVAPALPSGYTLIGASEQKIYIAPTGDLEVTFYYKASEMATITIKLYASAADKTAGNAFNTMTVSGVYGVKQTVNAPDVLGWTLAANEARSVELTPAKDKPASLIAEFVYDAVYDDITVTLTGVATGDIPAGWTNGSKPFQVQRGQGFTITAPSIVNYKLAENEQMEKSLSAAEINAGTKNVTFRYVKAEADLITITVEGVVDGVATPLYSYTKNVRQSATDVEVQIFTLNGYKLDNVKMGTNTTITATDGTYKINPNGKEQTVTATYSDNMVDVTINGYLKGTTTKLFDSFTVKAEAGKAFTYAQPSLIGYDTVTPIKNTIDAVKTGDSITFFYQKSSGNVTYKAVADNKDLAVKTVTVAKDGKIVNSTDEANKLFTIPYYQVKGEGVVTTNAADKTMYDGVNDVTVIYTYEKIKKTVKIEKYDQATGLKIDGAVQTTTALAAGETHNVTLTDVTGYTSLDSSISIFVDGTDDQTVKAYYKQSAEVYITVKQMCGGVLLNSYKVPAQYGVEQKIEVPEMQGYTKPTGEFKTTPVKDNADSMTVTLIYTLDAWTVTVKLVDKNDNPITSVSDFPNGVKTYQVKKGDGFTIAAPNVNGYRLHGNTLVISRSADDLNTEANRTITFTYDKIEDVIGDYQAIVTIKAQYNGYALADDRTQVVTKGKDATVVPDTFEGYVVSQYKVGATVNHDVPKNGVTVKLTENIDLYFIYTRPDNSVVLPGGDGKIPAPSDQDNVIVKPGVGTTIEGPKADGSVKIPDSGTGTVTRPDPDNKPNGKEDIIVPGGTTIDKDGTIHLPENGGTIGPNQKIPENLPKGYVAITYDSNNSNQEVKKEIGKAGVLKVSDSLFTDPSNRSFAGWNDSGSGNGKAYAKDTTVSANLTLYAVWDAQYRYSTNIIYKANDGTTNQDTQLVGHATDPVLKGKLQNSPFQVSGWTFGGWNEAATGSGTLYQPGDVLTLENNVNKTLFAQWFKTNADDSITVPGSDGNPNNPDTNATGNGNGTDKPSRNDKGEIEIPKGGSVTLPGGSVIGMPDGGKLLPDGTVIINLPDTNNNGKPDNTITVPGANGTDPDVKDENGNIDNTKTAVVLTYQANNGSGKEVKVYTVSGKATQALAKDAFTYSGHKFLYWQSGDKTYQAAAEITPNGDMTLSAVWAKVNPDGSIELPGENGKLEAPHDKDNVIVTPDNKDGLEGPKDDGSVEVNPDHDATVTRPDPDPTKPDTKEDIKVPAGTVILPDGTIKLPAPDNTEIKPGDKIPETTTAYVTVTFEAGNGTGSTIKQIVNQNSKINLLDESAFTAPANHFFVGWKDADGTSYDAGAEYEVGTAAVTFTAQYQDRDNLTKAVAIFDYAGGTDANGNGSKYITGKADAAITGIADPTRTGYTFDGWDNTDLKFGASGSVTEFTAQWTIKSYDVTFDVGDNTKGTMSGYTAPVTVEYGKSVPSADIPSIAASAGNVFVGWLNSSDNSVYTADSLKNYVVTGNVTFTAQYADASLATVIFVYAGGTLNGEHSKLVSATEGSAIGTLPEPTRDGYTLNGWTPAIADNATFGAAGTVTVYTAEWNENEKTPFTVTFDIDATKGSTADTTTETVADGGFVTKVPTVTAKAGYRFVGWMDQDNKLFYEAGLLLYPITKNTTFTAQFEEVTANPGTATVIFDANGGKIGNNSVLTKVGVPGIVVGVPTEPTRDGYKFLGWSGGFDASTVYGAESTTQTYTAQWETIEYTIHFSATGASGATADQTYKFDGTTKNTLNQNGFTLTGKDFLGWSLTDGATAADFADGALINDTLRAALAASNGSITLYAVWADGVNNTLTVTGSKATAKRDETVDFTAYLNGVATNAVTWIVTGGQSGTHIDANGVLTIGSNESNGTVLTVTAIFKNDTSLTASAAVRVVVDSNNNGGNNGGGTVSSSFVIKASAGNGGIISPSGNVSVKRGDDQTFVINPVNGYRIADVIVDGKSVDAVSLYTFENVRANHTIEVVFTKLNSIVADPTETGVAGWLQTREHIAYLGGYGNGLFGPNDNMTRAQVAQMFYNLLLEKDVPVTTSFSDVPADAWYAKAVNTLASLGIIKGIGNDQFAPNRTITRAEFTVIAMRFANVSATVTNPFTDIASSDWYYTAVTSAVSYGWITGYSDGTFKPMATITRAEVATIVNRMLARTADRTFVDSSAVTRFDDVPATYWAYYNIAEATTAHTHTIDNDGVESWGRLM